jgi:hydroxyacylglutathione hydrolase
MHFSQILNDELGCASYLIADGGAAIVVDPRWDVDIYVEQAARWGARITHAVDTHDHADHVSGRGRLARRTGATPLRPGAGLAPGDALRAGRVRLDALATPGHRPEHLAFAVTHEGRGDGPWCVLSGDSLLVGDVARPDLAVAPRQGARDLHASRQALYALGDHVELWPAHIGGSLCGGAGLSFKTSSTIGDERRFGRTAGLDPEAFVAAVAGAAPPKPPNLARVVGLNQGTLSEEPAAPSWLDAPGLDEALAAGATIVDARAADAFDAGHLRGALSLPPGPGRVTRVGWAAPADEPLVVIDETVEGALRLAGALHAIGLWEVTGVAAADPVVWRAYGLHVGEAARWRVDRLAEAVRAGDAAVVDVREEGEWAAGHLPSSLSLPLHVLGDGRTPVAALNGETIAVACAGGARAALAASLLRRAGHPDVIRVAGGGIGDLPDHGIALVTA